MIVGKRYQMFNGQRTGDPFTVTDATEDREWFRIRYDSGERVNINPSEMSCGFLEVPPS
jgi:hypothetical protein